LRCVAIEDLVTETATDKGARLEAGKLVALIGELTEAEQAIIDLAVEICAQENPVLGLEAVRLAIIGGGLEADGPDIHFTGDIEAEANIGGFGVTGRGASAE